MTPASLEGIIAVRSTWRGQLRYAVPSLAGWARAILHDNSQTKQRRPMPPPARYNTGYNVGVGGAVVHDGRLCAIRWLKENLVLGQTARRRSCNSVAMRVKGPPSRCRSDSVSPSSATGPQGAEAGINGGAWKPPSGYPV